jgi:hypothetical protein
MLGDNGLSGGQMGIPGWRKTIAFVIVVSFIGLGLARASESTPQFQEKAGTPVLKKHKKFPVLIVVGGLVVLGAAVYLVTKKKKDPTPPPVADVTLNFDAYNHTQAKLLDDYKITVKAGSTVNLTKALLNVNGVKTEYLILTQERSGETPGKWLAESNTGTLSITAPNSNTSYDLFFVNDGSLQVAQYWGSCDGAKRRSWTFYQQNWDQTGPRKPLTDAVAFMNTCLDNTKKTGLRYGVITVLAEGVLGNQASGDVRFGYYSYGGFGWHDIPGSWFSVNAEASTNDTSKYMIALIEGTELVTEYNNGIKITDADWEAQYTDAICLQILRSRN